tara:strand:- start:92 stop:430 length:339 start_codon:yes stop_codon:yes gene_type:complete
MKGTEMVDKVRELEAERLASWHAGRDAGAQTDGEAPPQPMVLVLCSAMDDAELRSCAGADALWSKPYPSRNAMQEQLLKLLPPCSSHSESRSESPRESPPENSPGSSGSSSG